MNLSNGLPDTEAIPDLSQPLTTSADLRIRGGRLVRPAEAVRVPGDKSITHRALLLALLAEGPLEIRGANPGGAVRALYDPLRALGIAVTETGTTLNAVPGAHPVADRPYLYTGGSSAAARLLIGLLAGLGLEAVVDGDAVLRSRPMDWLVDPLRLLGASIEYLGAEGRLPLAVHGKVDRPGSVELKIGSAQARAGVLLAAVAAGLPVTVRHPVRSRDHTERMLSDLGARFVETDHEVAFLGGRCRVPDVFEVPSDPSLAAYPVAAHLLWGDGSELRVPGVCLNPTRLGFFDVLRSAGAGITYRDLAEQHGERVGTVVASGNLRDVREVRVSDRMTLHALIDEVPLLTAVAATLPGTSSIECAEELRFKETDRLVTSSDMARSFGARVEVGAAGLRVTGGAPLAASAAVPGFEDHRVAMAAATLAVSLPGRTTVLGGRCHETSFPGFTDVLRATGADFVKADQK